jgi:hypothetical protein
MKPLHEVASLEQQFPHLRRELAEKAGWKTGWKASALAVTATIVAVALSAIFTPVMQAARDFSEADVPVSGTMPDDGFERLRWTDLVPKGWSPSHRIRGLQARHAGLADADPQARATLQEMREVLDAAPTEPSLEGRKVRIPGYVVPLGGRADRRSEFLLVPYFGACLHTPPPAANQVVHVMPGESIKGLNAMDTVWVRGTLRIARQESEAAVSGYRLTDASVEPYQASTKEARR